MSANPYPTVKFIAYEAREPFKVFIADPSNRGRYVYTDRAAALVACPRCKSIPCEPCRSTSSGGYVAYTHTSRRNKVRWGSMSKECSDVLKPRIKLKLEKT